VGGTLNGIVEDRYQNAGRAMIERGLLWAAR